MNIKPGTYNTPLGRLCITAGSEPSVSVETGEHDPVVVWNFTPDGTFQNFVVRFPDAKDEENEGQVIFACEHIDPQYKGQVYSIQGSGTDAFVSVVCPKCILLRGEVASGRKLNVLPVELWKAMKRNVTVIPLVIGG